jgi:hypothetical protein
MTEFKVKEDVLKAVLQYLSTRPYSEVVRIMEALQLSERIEPLTSDEAQEKND